MATEGGFVYDESFKAENDLRAKQLLFVELSAADQVDVCDNAADLPVGVLQNTPNANQAATVRILGITKVVTDGTANGGITVGCYLGTDGNGKAVKKTASSSIVRAIAYGASSADNVVIPAMLVGPFIIP